MKYILNKWKIAQTMETEGTFVWKIDALTQQTALALEAEWLSLAQNSIEKNIFLFPWYIIPSIPLLIEKKPEIITIYQDSILIGLFIVYKETGYAKLPFSFYRTALHPDQFSGTPLVRQGYTDQFAAGLCNWLDEVPNSNWFLLLNLMSKDREVHDAIVKYCKAHNRPLVELETYERAAIKPPLTLGQNSENHLSSNRRKSLRRKWRSLETQGAVVIEQLSDADEIDSWLEDFFRIENMGWKQEQGSSILSCEKETALYRAMIPQAHENDCLNFFRLTVDGKPIAYTLDITCGHDVFCIKCAYDPSYKKSSPGVLMEYETLKYYRLKNENSHVDSCTAPDNDMLNALWPDRKSVTSLAIARRSFFYKLQFSVIHSLKRILKKL